MKTVHMVLQGKGGVGKSLVSSLLCQYLEKQEQVTAIDTDPVNNTLAGYKALAASRLDIRAGDTIDPRKFDALMEIILRGEEQDDNHHIVIDNGASTFLPLCSYLSENQIMPLLRDAGVRVLLHTVFTGGQAMGDTADGMEALAVTFPDEQLVVWVNRYFGEIARNGKKFEEFSIYKKYSDKFHSLIRLPLKNVQTFGRDLEEMFTRRQTFADALADDSLSIMTRQRLKIWWNEMSAELDRAQLI
jgi:hypothetical protein